MKNNNTLFSTYKEIQYNIQYTTHTKIVLIFIHTTGYLFNRFLISYLSFAYFIFFYLYSNILCFFTYSLYSTFATILRPSSNYIPANRKLSTFFVFDK
jgi:hypothetical protein